MTVRSLNEGVRYVGLLLVAVFALAPFVWMLVMSLQGPLDVATSPPTIFFTPTLDNFTQVLGLTSGNQTRFDFFGDLTHSVILTGGSLAISSLLGIPAGYALARFRFPGQGFIGVAVLALYFAPALVIVLPLYLILQRLGVQGTFAGMLPVYQVISLPLMIWMSRSGFEEVPIETEEAARVDGASQVTVFLRVALPLAMPGIASGALLGTMFVWNNFFLGFIFSSPDTRPVTVGSLSYMGYTGVQWGPMAATILLAVLPVVVAGVVLQRYFVRGLTFGAVK